MSSVNEGKVQPSKSRPAVYKEDGLTLGSRRLGLLDSGREVGALGHLFSQVDPPLKWQTRALLEKLLGLIRARKGWASKLIFTSQAERFLFAAIAFTFGTGDKANVTILRPQNWQRFEGPGQILLEDLSVVIDRWSESDLTTLLIESASTEVFEIFVLPPDSVIDQSLVLKRFLAGQMGVMFVRDFSLMAAKFRADEYRDAGLVITETADGYGECWSLPR